MKYQIHTLPKWAQELIGGLEMRRKETQASLDQEVSREPTLVEYGAGWDEDKRFLANDEQVKFHLPSGGWIMVRHDRVEGLYVSGSGALRIDPVVSNVINLKII